MIKKIVRSCHVCFRYKQRNAEQLMAELPANRVTPIRAFTNVMVDYGGYFQIKTSTLRKASLVKCYMAVFVCTVTKAVHLELVSDLSTEAYIMALKRFVSRRGLPKSILSDNGTCFWGCRNKYKELKTFFQKSEVKTEIKNYCLNNFIEFKFLTPQAPHQGGLHEAGVKRAKYHIYRMLGDTKLTFEQFYTVLTQIEAVMNSRPLTPISNDANDLSSLTPGHFLIGESLVNLPERDILNVNENRLSVYEKLTRIQQTFWKRWSLDYLSELQARNKWYLERDNLKLNDLVLLKDDNLPPMKWKLARVIKIHPGSDGKVRNVEVRTSTGIYTRPITKLCILPLEKEMLAFEKESLVNMTKIVDLKGKCNINFEKVTA
ncbi:uncharacterized protein [Diabrotica undecimpunctata]|uniref:uncharacterized protein n=1 Tax=Diabrotica undecimpunctata TaxID=50387 RepID=UPI003B63ACA1